MDNDDDDIQLDAQEAAMQRSSLFYVPLRY